MPVAILPTTPKLCRHLTLLIWILLKLLSFDKNSYYNTLFVVNLELFTKIGCLYFRYIFIFKHSLNYYFRLYTIYGMRC